MSEHKCRCAGCTKAKKAGAAEERARILKAIEDAPPAMDFFGPYISKEKLHAVISGELEGN